MTLHNNINVDQKIQLKLIGYQSDEKYDVILDKNKDGVTNLKYIYLNFIRKGMNINDIKKLRFISSGTNLKDLEENILSSDIGNTNVFIFINDYQIKKNLLEKIFTNIPKDSINQPPSYKIETKLENLPLEDDVEEIYEPSDEDINNINEKIMENFKDKDFIELLRICMTKPELLKKVSGYLENGDVIDDEDNFNIDNIEDFNFEREYQYIKNFLEKDLNIEVNSFIDENIKKVLIHFKGHLNLSLRFILSKYCEDKEHL